MTTRSHNLGFGIGWRPELALAIERRAAAGGIGFVELVAESIGAGPVPAAVESLRSRGVQVVVHGIGLSLGGAEPIDLKRVDLLSNLARRVNAPLVSEHICFVRGGGIDSGHLLPLPRTREALDVIVENINEVKRRLSVPLALENIATLFEWPHAEMTEAQFLTEVLERTDTSFLLDVSNVFANACNFGVDPFDAIDQLPLDRVAYAHVGGGVVRGNTYHDSHAHAVPDEVLTLLEHACARGAIGNVMLERDDFFPTEAQLNVELDAIASAVKGMTPRLEHARSSGAY